MLGAGEAGALGAAERWGAGKGDNVTLATATERERPLGRGARRGGECEGGPRRRSSRPHVQSVGRDGGEHEAGDRCPRGRRLPDGRARHLHVDPLHDDKAPARDRGRVQEPRPAHDGQHEEVREGRRAGATSGAAARRRRRR